jgi:hypothetical protein
LDTLEDLFSLALGYGFSPQQLFSKQLAEGGTTQDGGPLEATGDPNLLTEPTMVGGDSAVVPMKREAKPGAGKGAAIKLEDIMDALALIKDKKLRDRLLENIVRMGLKVITGDDGSSLEAGMEGDPLAGLAGLGEGASPEGMGMPPGDPMAGMMAGLGMPEGSMGMPEEALAGEMPGEPEMQFPAMFREGGVTQDDDFAFEIDPETGERRRRPRADLPQLPTNPYPAYGADGVLHEPRSEEAINQAALTATGNGQIPLLPPTGSVPIKQGNVMVPNPSGGGQEAVWDEATGTWKPISSPAPVALAGPAPAGVGSQPSGAGGPPQYRSMTGGRDASQWRLNIDTTGGQGWRWERKPGSNLADGLQEEAFAPGLTFDRIPDELAQFIDAGQLFSGVSPQMAAHMKANPGSMSGANPFGGKLTSGEWNPQVNGGGSGGLQSSGPGVSNPADRAPGGGSVSGSNSGTSPVSGGSPTGAGSGTGSSGSEEENYVTIDGQRIPVADLRNVTSAYGQGTRPYERAEANRREGIASGRIGVTQTNRGILNQMPLPVQGLGEVQISPVTGAVFKFERTPNGGFDLYLQEGVGPDGRTPKLNKVRTIQDLNEVKMVYAGLVGGGNPASEMNPEFNSSGHGGNLQGRYELDPTFRKAADQALGYYDSDEGLRGRVSRLAERDPIVAAQIHDAAVREGKIPAVPMSEDEARGHYSLPVTEVFQLGADGKSAPKPGVRLINETRDAEGLASGVFVMADGLQYQYMRGKDTLTLLDPASGGPKAGAPGPKAEPQPSGDQTPATGDQGQTAEPAALEDGSFEVETDTGTVKVQKAGISQEFGTEVYQGEDGSFYWWDSETSTWNQFEAAPSLLEETKQPRVAVRNPKPKPVA